MEAVWMLLGFGRAVGRFFGYEPPDLGENIRLALGNRDHQDLPGLFRAHEPVLPPDDLDEQLVTVERYLALFEALNWGVSLDDRLSADWPYEEICFGRYWCDEFAGGGLIRGLRHARNAVHHDWSLALDVDPVQNLFQKRIELLWLCWNGELTADRADPDSQRAFQENLAERVVGNTLLEISKLLEEGVRLAMGHLPRQRSGPAMVKQSAEDRYVADDSHV
jgi:hypothetical protein